MDFEGISSLEELIKKATITVLLKKIGYVVGEGCVISPVQCPGLADNKPDILVSANKEAVCLKGTQECPYFQSAIFDINGYIKEIQCKVR